MPAEVYREYRSYCEDCGWESDPDDYKYAVEAEADKHNEAYHAEAEDKPSFQENLDEIMRENFGKE